MNKPVWYLFGRFDIVSGSTGYYRYQLLDAAISRFGEWWLIGTKSTEEWGPGLSDITNQFLLEGVRGGIWALILYVVIIGYAFAGVGKLLRKHRNDRLRLMMSWALGVTLVTHCANFMAISYFGQIVMIWYLLLAIIGSLSVAAERRVTTAAANFRDTAPPIRHTSMHEGLPVFASERAMTGRTALPRPLMARPSA